MGLVLAPSVFAISPSSIFIDATPANPAPHENVTINLRSFAANLDSVSISWFVNGRNVLTGVGRKSFSVNAPVSGSETQIIAKIFLPEGEIEKKVVIRPSQMVLLWQANDSYVPPFYKGKALPVEDSSIKVVAIPEARVNGNLISPKNMTYVWKKDYSNVPDASGYGKSFFIYKNDYLEDSDSVGVVASTTNQNYSSEARVNINTTTPKIIFYKRTNDLGIIWEREIKNGHIINGEEVVVAAPYFITPKDIRRPELVFKWRINDKLMAIQNFNKNLIPLRVGEGISGTSKLNLEIENADKIFQTARKEINVEF